jgi:fructokinase
VIQVGIDFGGTKVEAAALDAQGAYLARVRAPNPGAYDAAIETVRDLIAQVEQQAGGRGTIGIGTPGSISPTTGVMRNSNSVYLNGRTFREDLTPPWAARCAWPTTPTAWRCPRRSTGPRPARAWPSPSSWAPDAAAAWRWTAAWSKAPTASPASGGTSPCPGRRREETPGPRCWCGQRGCLEMWVSGTGLQHDFAAATGVQATGEAIIARFRQGEPAAVAAFDRYVDRLGRAIAVLVNIADPDVLVLAAGCRMSARSTSACRP